MRNSYGNRAMNASNPEFSQRRSWQLATSMIAALLLVMIGLMTPGSAAAQQSGSRTIGEFEIDSVSCESNTLTGRVFVENAPFVNQFSEVGSVIISYVGFTPSGEGIGGGAVHFYAPAGQDYTGPVEFTITFSFPLSSVESVGLDATFADYSDSHSIELPVDCGNDGTPGNDFVDQLVAALKRILSEVLGG